MVQIEQNEFAAAAGLSGCRLVNSITPVPAVLLRHALGKVDGHLGMDDTPVLPPSSALLGNIHYGQVQHFQQAVIGGKDRFSFGHLAELAVKTLNGVGGAKPISA